jgi:hypothetical protein
LQHSAACFFRLVELPIHLICHRHKDVNVIGCVSLAAVTSMAVIAYSIDGNRVIFPARFYASLTFYVLGIL